MRCVQKRNFCIFIGNPVARKVQFVRRKIRHIEPASSRSIVLHDQITSIFYIFQKIALFELQVRNYVIRTNSHYDGVKSSQRSFCNFIRLYDSYIITDLFQTLRNFISSTFNITDSLSLSFNVQSYNRSFGRHQNRLFWNMIVLNGCQFLSIFFPFRSDYRRNNSFVF
ncbi:hypothetical protein D3C72_769890 [compost metagenome]